MNKTFFNPFFRTVFSKNSLLYLFTFLPFYLFIACTNDPYETGDGTYSYLCAEFAELTTTAATTVPGATTDADESLLFDKPFQVKWAEKADTVYRALLYYNKVENAKPQAVSAVQVPVLYPSVLNDGEEMHADPLSLESSWTSANGKYFNLSLLLKTGVEEGLDGRQTIGVVITGVTEHADGTKHYDLQLYHNQNNVPQYYTSRVYVSIPLKEFRSGDTATLTVNTYQDTVVLPLY